MSISGTKRERKRNRPRKNEKNAPGQVQSAPSKTTPPFTSTFALPNPTQRIRSAHPLFPVATPVHSVTPVVMQQQPLPIRNASQPRSSFVARPAPSFALPTPVSGTTQPVDVAPSTSSSHRFVEVAFKPTSITKNAATRPSFYSDSVSTTSMPISRTTTSILDRDPGPSRTFFAGRRDKQGAPRGIVHTRWQGSGNFQFDARPRESHDPMESEDED